MQLSRAVFSSLHTQHGLTSGVFVAFDAADEMLISALGAADIVTTLDAIEMLVEDSTDWGSQVNKGYLLSFLKKKKCTGIERRNYRLNIYPAGSYCPARTFMSV